MVKSSIAGARTRAARTWRRVRRRWLAPQLGEPDIIEALERLAPAPPATVMVHSSLSACGLVSGGALTVIRALRSWSRGGTLAMPAHSYCYPLETATVPVFDLAVTPSVVGAITDTFWRQPGVLRSRHPTHSLAAQGEAAGDLIAGHEACVTPCGAGTPYARLVQMNAAVVMFGATLDAYTLFHTAEDAAGAAYLYEAQPVSLRFIDADRMERAMSMRRQDMSVARSFAAKDTWLEQRGLLRRTGLGTGELLLLPHASRVHAAVVAELLRDPGFLKAGSPA